MRTKLKCVAPPKLNIQMQLLKILRQLPSSDYFFVQNTEKYQDKGIHPSQYSGGKTCYVSVLQL